MRREKGRNGKGRKTRGRGREGDVEVTCFFLPVTSGQFHSVNPSLRQAQRGSSDKLVVCVPVGQMSLEVKCRADGTRFHLPQYDTAPGSRGAMKRMSALALMQ